MRQGADGTREGDNVKRHLLVAAVFLLAGAVVNVAVAWGCAIWIDLPFKGSLEKMGGSQKGSIYKSWLVWTLRKHGAFRVYSRWTDPYAGSGVSGGILPEHAAPLVPEWAPFLAPTYEPSSRARHAYFADARGWPLHSMWSGLKVSNMQGRTPPSIKTLGIALDPEMMADYNDHENLRLLPLRPLPLGFMVNTLLYATVLWLLIPGPFALRRLIRVKRGCCPTCGYPKGESAICSECGNEPLGRAGAAT